MPFYSIEDDRPEVPSAGRPGGAAKALCGGRRGQQGRLAARADRCGTRRWSRSSPQARTFWSPPRTRGATRGRPLCGRGR